MLKADAYGHGAVNIARASVEIVDYFGVASAEEGVELRLNGIHKPVLVTVFSAADSALVSKHNLTPIIYNTAHANALSLAAVRASRIINVHIKVDTGMNRLGVKTLEEYQTLVNAVKCLPNLSLEGVCTHFYDSGDSVLIRQKAVFDRFLDCYRGAICHAASSNALIKDKAYHYDMVRVGIAAYGYSETEKYQPVMSVLSSVIAVKEVNKGEAAGYSAVYKAEKDTRLAIVRGGYYDGIMRSFTGANIIIGGKTARIVAVCMDVCIADIGDIEVKADDIVVIIGSMARYINTADEIALHSRTIPYEIMTGIKGRIERIYYD
jgi:alanine racemase